MPIPHSILNLTLLIYTGIFFLVFTYASIISIIEKESYAAKKFIWTALLLSLPYLIVASIDFSFKEITTYILLIVPILSAFIFLIPIKGTRNIQMDAPKNQIDERDIVFSRRKLKKGSDRYKEYYKRRPEYEPLDELFKSKPGLVAEGATHYHPVIAAATDATFFAVEQYIDQVDGKVADKKRNYDPKEMAHYIKQWTKHLGALDVGITELQEYHKYSIGGRTFNYDEKVELNHKYAIAFTVEMDHYMTATGPFAPSVLESAQQYLNAGSMAIQLSAFLRNLGHEARAHIDGHYQVLCPLVARDAGLGEIGRMGLMMTPKLGPRVRIAVVTTNIPLEIDHAKEDKSVIDFCNKCMKCAEVCPSNSISFNDRELIDGVNRWQIDSTSCFTFWCSAGTDCGKCMSTCPYAHPDNILHNFIRFGIRNNVFFRKLAILLDDYFYGRKPLSKKVPKWMEMNEIRRLED